MAPCLSKFTGASKLSCEECWVTLAEDDTAAVRAIVLAKCLRRVVTTRKIAVVIAEQVSESHRKMLQAHFDQCLKLNMPLKKKEMPAKLHAKMFCWSMPFMRKCIFLDNETLVLKNCDELFDIPGTSVAGWKFNCNSDNPVDSSVIVLEPSFDDFTELCTLVELEIHGMKETRGREIAFEAKFVEWLMKRKAFSVLPARYNLEINLERGYMARNENNLCIVRFAGLHPMEIKINSLEPSNVGIIEKAVLKYWEDIYFQEVATIVKNPSLMPMGGQKTNRLALPNIAQAVFDANKEPIAIIGMSCRFPMANNVDEYWDVLINGKDCIRKVPDDRWPSATSPEFRDVQAGFLKCPVDEFDGKFFNISPMELTHTDPQQRLLLEVSWEALEHAGIDPQSLAGTNAGVFVGTWTQDYRDLIKNLYGDFSDFHRTYMGNSLGGTSGRLSFLLGLTGPNIASESGCSSGMVAVYLACENLRQRRSNIALAAGANLLLHPFEKRHMVNLASPDGHCKTFDEKADGFGRAEGVATLILKRYSDAVKAGDNILALIRGCGIAQEGTSRSFGTPTKEAQEIAMQAALDDAGVSPEEISYLEAHGTGTVIGDTTEMAAITNLYCKTPRTKPLYVASAKTNIGHTESCSGMAGLIKVILSMNKELIPPHINLNTLNPHINLKDVPIQIPKEPVKWEAPDNGLPRIAGISSFGITGTNTHVILQEPPNYTAPAMQLSMDDRPLHILTFSAKSKSNLESAIESYMKYFEEVPESICLGDIAYTCNTGRAHFPHRVSITASSVAEAKQKLRSASNHQANSTSPPGSVCFMFTGQGSQYEGMAKTLYETSPVFRMHFDKCDQLLLNLHGISVKTALWSADDKALIHTSLYSQTSIFCIEYCIAKLWESWGIKPDAVMGHSLGEFAAAVCADMLSLEDGLELVAQRSQFIEHKTPRGHMIVVKTDKLQAEKVRNEFLSENPTTWLDFAAFNSADQTVLSGSPPTVDLFALKCKQHGLKTHILQATNAFHSRDMDVILSEYRAVVNKVKFSKPICKFISGVTGKVMEDNEMNAEYWVQHTRDAVEFVGASNTANELGFQVYLEVGPQPVLSALIMANSSISTTIPVCLPSLRKSENEWSTLLGSLGRLYQMGFNIDWLRFDQFYNRKKVHLPSYPFSRKKHWHQTNDRSKEGIVFNTKSIHPLLGCQIPNATSNSIFQSTIGLEKITYLKDHSIGELTIFPAAGYLDMCLTSGCLATTGQLEMINPVSVENLTIEAPLQLSSDSDFSCHFQTVVSQEENEDSKICIYTRKIAKDDDSIKWIRQAVASFVPLQINYHLDEEVESLQVIKKRCQLPVETYPFYNQLSTVGLKFGATFQSLRKLWKSSSNEHEVLSDIFLSSVDDTNDHYMVHPIVLDALIQTIMVGMIGYNNNSLYVPLIIGKIVVFAKSTSQQFYGHCSWTKGQSPETRSATLYEETGKIIAIISNVQMIETSAEAIVKTITAQSLSIPNTYEEIWRPKMGPLKNRTNLKVMNGDYLFSNEFRLKQASCLELTPENVKMVSNRRRIVYCYILKAFYELGWTPAVNDVLSPKEFMSKLQILPCFEKLIRRYFTIIAEEGPLQKIESDKWGLVNLPPTLAQVSQAIDEGASFIRNHPEETGDARVTIGCGNKLETFLTGKESALSFLFPEDKTSEITAETFYNESVTVKDAHKAVKATLAEMLQAYSSVPEEQRGVIRFLEVGAGTGSTTKRVLPILDEFKAKYHYTYTDISPAFFLKAQPMLESYGPKIQYKVLNIEDDPLEQGFIPNHYDVVIASNVLHATHDLADTIRNVRSLLKDDGLLLMVETLEPIREYDVVFGLLDGFWRFDDYSIRSDYPNVSAGTWEAVCSREGYDQYAAFPCFGGQVGVIIARASSTSNQCNRAQVTFRNEDRWWIVFSDEKVFPKYLQPHFESVGRQVIVVTKASAYDFHPDKCHFQVRSGEKADFVSIFDWVAESKWKIEGIAYLWGLEPEGDQVEMTTGLLFLAQILLSTHKGLPRLVLVTEGTMPVGDQTAMEVQPSALWGMIRSFRTEHFNMHVRSIDMDPDDDDLEAKYMELFTEFWNDDQEYQISYRQRSRHVCRLVQCKDIFGSPLSLPNSERYSLILPASKNIADLKFCPNGKSTLAENEIEIEVKATGLNFRDVFVVLKPEKQFESMNCLGLEFSGIVIGKGGHVKHFDIGDNVMGCKFADGALPSHIQMDEDLVFHMPAELTYLEAATIPAAWATAFYGLIEVAKLQKGETVLIHAGSGGVGLFAIQVAKALGAHIIATAGSRRKRAFLRNFGVEHVFHSRNTDYGHQITEVTQGKGVHVVLNSLTSAGFKEASLNVCCKNARFVEMSKLHVWTEEEVRNLRPDVDYTIIYLANLGKSWWQNFWKTANQFIRDNLLRPIPYVRFEAQRIREALTFMQKARHIGKIIVAMPQMRYIESRMEPVVQLFNEKSTYLITGGLGGLGIAVTEWMCKNGAKHIVLTSRREPDENAERAIRELKSQGNNIVILTADVGSYDQCRKLFEAVKDPQLKLPTLRGIIHAAGELSDATYVNQSVESFQRAFRGKVYGAWFLHQLSKNYPLEHFMMFSSMLSIFGPVGLANYAAANAYLDALCHYRCSLGLCAQVINWGQWAEVGTAKDITIPAVKPFSPKQGLLALEAIMKSQKQQIAVLDVDFTYVRKLTSNVGTYLEELKIAKGNQAVAFTVKIGNFWSDFSCCDSEAKRMELLKSYVGTILRQILKFDDDEVIDENQNFSEMGMDSLMMLEMKNFLQTMLGKNIAMNVSEMAELTTINKLASHVQHLIHKSEESKSNGQEIHSKGTTDNHFPPELRKVIEEDMILPDSIRSCGQPCQPSEIRTILLTGATGNLGPYILEALVKSSVQKVYCLIRARNDSLAKRRLLKTLGETGLSSLDLSKVEYLAGDITRLLLGLTEDKYGTLCKNVDAIVHCAAFGNMTEPYLSSDSNSSSIRRTNVEGTRNVLEFAGTGKTKRVLHASTLMCHKMGESDLFEDWSDDKAVFQMTNVGYPVSKMVCEVLAHEAVKRGIPVQVQRFPGLLGDKKGCFSFSNNQVLSRLIGFCKLRALPKNPTPLQVLDVDFAAEISCKIFFNEKASSGIYNLTNPKTNTLLDFPQLAKDFEFNIEVVSYEELTNKISENKNLAALSSYREIDVNDVRYLDLIFSPVIPKEGARTSGQFFVSQKMVELIPGYQDFVKSPLDILRKDLKFARDNGFF